MQPGDSSKLGNAILSPPGCEAHNLVSSGMVPSPSVFFCIVLVMFFSSLVTEKVITYIFLFLQEEDDWKEFEQKEEVDYSGLRVQSMQIRYYFFLFFFRYNPYQCIKRMFFFFRAASMESN